MLHDLAQQLRIDRDAVVARWMSAVRADGQIPAADRLSDAELRDHLGALLTKLARQLSSPAHENAPEAQPEPEAEIHGILRWQQHYKVDELVREIGVLRACFLELFCEFLKQRRQIDTEEFLRSTQLVHHFFDEICTESVASYVRQREQQAESNLQGLQRLNEQLEQTNRQYESEDSFRRRTLRTVAHEMATPVNALGLGMSYLSESDDPTERQEASRLVSRTMEHLRTMLDQLLDFSRTDGGMERLKIAEFAVPPLFDYLVSSFEPLAAAKRIDFVAELDPALATVRSDENKVQRVAVNLLSNAIKYCDEGRVSLAIRAAGDREWVIEVSDTGCGIPRGEADRIFTEFQRLSIHSERPGLGLGLAIVRTLLDRLGGRISMESEVGKGSRFTVRLPRTLG